MNPFLIVLIILVVLGTVGWLGLQIKPRAFSQPALAQGASRTIPLPDGLPAPVERFYRTLYGERIPVLDSAVITGRGRMRPFGIWLPTRFVFVHLAGQAYRHYFEATFFGLPLLKVNEGYIEGVSFFESPMGTFHNDANTNQGANLALWAEAGWFPSLWVTDRRVRWETVDDHTALLFVPFEDQSENYVVRFDPQTGLINTMEAMRYRDPGEGKNKLLWITRNEQGNPIPEAKISAVASATWFDQGKPWATFMLEGIEYNVDVLEYVRARGC